MTPEGRRRAVLVELGALVGHKDPQRFAEFVLAPPCDHAMGADYDPDEVCDAPCGQTHYWCRGCSRPLLPECPIVTAGEDGGDGGR